MNFILHPWQVVVFILSSWMNQQQQQMIEYLRTENEVLKEKLGTKRILLNDDQRRRLAVKGKTLGRKTLAEIGTLFTPDTILRWHRLLVARKWDYSKNRKSTGRPRVDQEIVELVLRFARENPGWGYDRIQGALANLGHKVSDQSVGNILKDHGIEPAPKRTRPSSWKTFIKAHWDVLAAIDFTTVEVWTKGGLVTIYLLFVMDLKTRRVHLAACTASLGDDYMKQVARNLTDSFDGFLLGKKAVLMDRDANFSSAFRTILEDADVNAVRLPPKSPNLNSHLERFHLSIKSECLSRMIFFGEKSLRHAVDSFLQHYHAERNHQGLSNNLIDPTDPIGRSEGEIECRERLGGMLNYYHRKAA
jgi:putative transposase